jgi:hypothetical protein
MPACVNPDHLFIGTNADNVADCKNKGRLALHDGENNGNAKLSNKIVDIIRNSTARADDLALQLGVHWSTVYRIRSKSIWKEKSECPSQ